MEMTGSYRIAAPRDVVWAALNDPEVLKACIPGCESLEKLSDTEMRAAVTSKIGPVKAKFTGKVNLLDLNPPESYTISGEGSGGAAGFAKGGADVKLTEDGADTVLTYTAKAQVGGKIAQLGARLIDGVAKKMADEFFSKFAARVGAAPAADGMAAQAPELPDVSPAPGLAASDTDIGPAEIPGEPGPVPIPERHPAAPAAPATHPPTAPFVPSNPAMVQAWYRNGGVLLVIAIVVIVIIWMMASRG
jgi:carbon monoxide dehydrogenase subunit G